MYEALLPYHHKVLVILLLISLLTSSFPLRHTFAQTNELVGVLVADAMEDLREGNIEAASVHVNLARQQISLGENGSALEFLLDDVINDLEQKDKEKAFVHLNLTQSLLGSPVSSPIEQQKSKKNDTTSFRSQRFPAYGFEIQYPSSWNITDEYNRTGTWNSVVTLVPRELPLPEPPDTIDATALSVLVGTTSKSLNQIVAQLDRWLSWEGNPFFNIEEVSPARLSGYAASKIVFTFKGGTTDTTILQVLSKNSDILYNITYASKSSQYLEYLPEVERIIESFKITGKPSNSVIEPVIQPGSMFDPSMFATESEDRGVQGNTSNPGVNTTFVGSGNASGFIEYENPNYGFKIQYPSDWEKLELNKRTTSEGTTNLIVSFRGQGVRFDITTLDKKYASSEMDKLFDERLQMYTDSGYSISNSHISSLSKKSYPAYTIRAEHEGCATCIITEYGMIANDTVYLLSWDFTLSNRSEYQQLEQVAGEMIYSFEGIPSSNRFTASKIPTSMSATSYDYSNQSFAAGQQTSSFPASLQENVTSSGAMFLGSFYQDGDRYINLDNPSTTCIDNNSNLVCDATESNPPLSCRYDRACSSLPGQPLGFTNGSSTGPVQQTNNSSFYPPVSSQQNRINWLEICMNPLVDYVITEPCSTLATPDGYTLTPEGERVLRCLAGGALVGLLAPEMLIEIKELGPAVNCGG